MRDPTVQGGRLRQAVRQRGQWRLLDSYSGGNNDSRSAPHKFHGMPCGGILHPTRPSQRNCGLSALPSLVQRPSRETLLSRLAAVAAPVAKETAAGMATVNSPGLQACDEVSSWGDPCFLWTLWLNFHVHVPGGWGYCPSYGQPPLRLCWQCHWQEDLRHVACALAQHLHRFHNAGVLNKLASHQKRLTC